MATINELSPVISLSVSLFVFCIFFGYLLLKPSAKRTILLTTPTSPLFNLKRNKLKEKCKDPEVISDNPRKDKVNPIYWWLVQPQEDTGLKEGRFSLARSSQRTFPYDQKKIRRSSSLYTDSSENLSRNSSISMSTLISSLSVDLSRTASSVSTSASVISDDNVPNYGACSNSKRDSEQSGDSSRNKRTSFLYGFLKNSGSN